MGDTEPLSPKPIILLVEPNISLNSLIVGMLTREQYGMYPATEAEQALQICQEAKEINLLITDVFLFGASGIELANQARKLHASIKVLFISSTDENVLRMQGLPEGSSVIEKPLALTDLLAKVDELLR